MPVGDHLFILRLVMMVIGALPFIPSFKNTSTKPLTDTVAE
jgi:hypothetical protein